MDKAVKDLTRYKFDTFSEILSFYVLFIAMFLGVKIFGHSMNVSSVKLGNTLEGFVAGYFLWTIMVMAYSDVSYGIVDDATRGTLEQLNMSNLGLHNILIARSISNILIYLLMSFIVLFSIMATTGYWLHLKIFSAIIFIFIGIFSILGISLILGGLALIFKKIKSLLNVIQFCLIALVLPANGAFSKTGVTLIPFRPSIENVYASMIGGKSLATFSLESYGQMILNSAIYLTIGLLIFKRCCIIAKQKGLLGQY